MRFFIGLYCAYIFFVPTAEAQNVSDINLERAPLIYNSPKQNESATIQFMIKGDAGEIVWTVISEPKNSSIKFNQSSDNKKVTFIAKEVGNYAFLATSENGTKRHTSFTILPVFTFNKSKLVKLLTNFIYID